jgi:predicted transcriptional regulator YheO
MDQKGIFLIKGAIDKVAEKLNISKVTVYSYLDEIKDKDK